MDYKVSISYETFIVKDRKIRIVNGFRPMLRGKKKGKKILIVKEIITSLVLDYSFWYKIFSKYDCSKIILIYHIVLEQDDNQ